MTNKKNTLQARAAAAAKLPPEAPAGVPTRSDPAAKPAVPEQGMPFNIDQLFAAYGAKDFENTLLRQRVLIAEQQVVTLQNVIRTLETQNAGTGEKAA